MYKTVWSEWKKGECSVTCGKGTVTSTRSCVQGDCVGESTKTEDCEKQVCPGLFKLNEKLNSQVIQFCLI